jgi:secondary thiamine-phosphate synthase enzyme
MTMNVARHQLQLETTAPIEVIDISDRVRAWVRASGVRHGLLTVMSLHTTARVNLNERESELQHDMVAFLTRLVPREGAYRHNVHTVDDRDNAHAHLLGLMLNASESIPVADGELVMGGWQSIFFIELDGPRARREVELHLIGEA